MKILIDNRPKFALTQKNNNARLMTKRSSKEKFVSKKLGIYSCLVLCFKLLCFKAASSPTFGGATEEFFPVSWLLTRFETLSIGLLKDFISKPVLDVDLQQEKLNMSL